MFVPLFRLTLLAALSTLAACSPSARPAAAVLGPKPALAATSLQDQPPSGSQPTSSRSKPVKIIPWIEVNKCTEKEIDDCVAGLEIWRKVTDTAIVSTVPGRADLYSTLRPRLPGMTIIPGVKTSTPLKVFDSVEGWKTVAEEVRRMCAAAGVKRCALENESALYDHSAKGKNYWLGEPAVDPAKLAAGVKLLPRDVEILFYPSFVCGSQKNRAKCEAQSEAIGRVLEDNCDVRFVDYELAKPPERNDWWAASLGTLRDRIVRKPSIPIIYFWGTAAFWPEDGVKAAMSAVRGDEAIIYPGASRWRLCAELFAKQLGDEGR